MGIMTMSPNELPLFPTLPRAARAGGFSPRILRLARDRGELSVYQVGDRWQRVYLPEFLDWVRNHRVKPASKGSNSSGASGEKPGRRQEENTNEKGILRPRDENR